LQQDRDRYEADEAAEEQNLKVVSSAASSRPDIAIAMKETSAPDIHRAARTAGARCPDI
jgi:hypothetical protein